MWQKKDTGWGGYERDLLNAKARPIQSSGKSMAFLTFLPD